MARTGKTSDVMSHRNGQGRRRLTRGVWVTVVALAAGSAVTVGIVSQKRGAGTGCESPATVVVAAPASLVSVLEPLAAEWTATQSAHDGRCLAATVVRRESSEVATALGPDWNQSTAGPRPDVWVPESSLWLLVAQGRPEAAQILSPTGPSIATSPVVLAFRREMAQALGWPQRELGWEDVIGAIIRPDVWSQAGHPEWAKLRLGIADPTVSAAGLASVLSMLDQDGDGNVADAELGAAVGLSQSLGSMAPDTATFFTAVANGSTDPTSAVAAFPAIERDIAAHNRATPEARLVPVYPRQGTIVADYPYAILSAGWVDADRREAADGFLQYILGSNGREALTAAGFRRVDGRSDGVLSADEGFRAELPALRRAPDAASFSQIIGTWTALQRPANTLVVVDTSGSMRTAVERTNMTRLQLMQQTASAGFEMLTNRTSIGLWQFSSQLTPTTDYRVLVPFGPMAGDIGGVPRKQALYGAVAGLRAGGGTGLYDTLYAAFGSMQGVWQPDTTNVILVITDGRNESDAGLSLTDLLARLKREARADRPTPIVGVAVGPEADAAALQQISLATGGRTFVVRDPAAAVNTLILAFAGRLR